MKLTVQQLLTAGPVIRNLVNQPLKAHVAFKVGRLARLMEPEMKAAEEGRLSLIKEHGEQKGDAITVKPENIEAFIAALTPLLESEVTINGLDPLPLAALEDATMTAADMLLLEELKLLTP